MLDSETRIYFFSCRVKKFRKPLTKHSMRSRFSVSTNIHNGSSNPSNRFYRLIILNLLYSQYNHLERDHHEFKKATMASLCIPRTLPPVCSETVEDKIDKISSRKGGGRADCLLAHNERTRYNKFVAPCESEVSLLLGHTLRIACTLKRRNNAAYKFRGIAEALFDREFLRGTHFSSDKFYTSLDLVFIASMMNLRKLFLKEKEKEKIFEEA